MKNKSKEERELIEALIRSGIYGNNYEIEVPIPTRYIPKNNSYEELLKFKCSLPFCYRIDAVFHSGREVIVEAKSSPSPKALGQLICYKHLWSRAHGINLSQIDAVCVFYNRNKELENIFLEYGITLIHIDRNGNILSIQ